MKTKRIIAVLLVAGACVVPGTSSFAAGAVNVLWDKQAVNGVERYDASVIKLADAEVLQSVGRLVDQRLSHLKVTGQLPFNTEIIADYKNNDWKSKMGEDRIALVPVITSDANTHKMMTYKNTNYYTYEVRTELNLMLCKFDGTKLSVIHNLPLANQAVLGGSLEDALTEPLGVDVLKEQFVYNVEQMLEDISFPTDINDKLQNSDMRITCQVKEVNVAPAIRANYAHNTLSDRRINLIAKPIIASTYTSYYAKKISEYCVLPSKLSGNSWKKEVVRHITGGDIAAAEYNASLQEEAGVGITVSIDNFSARVDNGNQYSLMRDLYFTTELSAWEEGGMSLGNAVSVAKYRLPKTIGYEVQWNYSEIFNDAAVELGQKLSEIKLPKKSNRKSKK